MKQHFGQNSTWQADKTENQKKIWIQIKLVLQWEYDS